MAVASPLPSTMDMGGCPVDGKRFGKGGVLTSDSSDSDEDRSATSGGTRPTGSAGETGTAETGAAETVPAQAWALADPAAKAWGWRAAPCAVVAACADPCFFGQSLEGV